MGIRFPRLLNDAPRVLALAAALLFLWVLPAAAFDTDGDGVQDNVDNCPFTPNAGQQDAGRVGSATPDGIGNACQCGDVNGDGAVNLIDSILIQRSLLQPPTAVLTNPALCDVNGDGNCTIADAAVIRRALLAPPTATVQQLCVPAKAPTPNLVVTQPAFGQFFAPGPGNQCNVTFAGSVSNVDNANLQLTIGGTPTPTAGSAFNVQKALSDPLQQNVVAATRLVPFGVKRVNTVVSCADSIAANSPALSGVGLRINDSGIDKLEPVLNQQIATQLGNVGDLVKALSPIQVNQCVLDASIGCAVNLDSVTINNAGLGAFGVGLDSVTNAVNVSATANNLFADYEAELTGPNCSGHISATSVDLSASFGLSPAANPRNVDVNLLADPTVGFTGFTNDFTGGVCSFPIIESVIDLFVGNKIQTQVHDAVVNALKDPDGAGPQDSPLADAAESAFTGLQLSQTIGGALGINFDAPFNAILEDNVGITLRIDANINPASIDPTSPQPNTSLKIASTFPTYGSNAPNGSPYMAALSIDPTTMNKLLRSELQQGNLKFDVTTLNFDLVNPALGLGTRTITTTLLGLILPDFASQSPAENVAIQIRPQTAPAVLDPTNTPATEIVRAAGVQVDFVGQTTGKRFIRLAVAGNVNLNVGVVAGNLDVSVNNVSGLQAALVEDNIGSVSQLTVDILMAIIAPLGNFQITQSLESIPLPTILGLGIVPVQIQNDFNGNFLNVFLNLQ